MDIILTADDRAEILHLPIIPEKIEIHFPHNNQIMSTVSDGDIKLIGMPGLKGFTLDTWFPMKRYTFARSNATGVEGKEFITKWKRKRRPIRIVIVNNNGLELHNELYAIDDFVFGYDRVGDMPYKLTLEQFVAK